MNIVGSGGARIVGVLALVAHLAVGAFPYLGTPLVAPLEGVVVLWGLWLVLLGGGVWLWLSRPAWTLAVPLAALVLWLGVITLGDWLFGWTA